MMLSRGIWRGMSIRGKSRVEVAQVLVSIGKMEEDHTTDVRRWKLKLYQECGFPEIRVSVPDETSVRNPGLTIHLRDGGGYRCRRRAGPFPAGRAGVYESPIQASRWF